MTWAILDTNKSMKVIKEFNNYEIAWEYLVENHGTGSNRYIIYNMDNEK